MPPDRADLIRWAVAALTLLGVMAAVLAARSWDDARPGVFLAWTVVAAVSIAAALLGALPAPARTSAVGVGAALLLVAVLVGWRGVVAPRTEASAAYDGEGVAWTRALPTVGAEDADDVVTAVTALSGERAVVVRGSGVQVIDPSTGRQVESLTPPAGRGATVARTVDGFALTAATGGAVDFHDADGAPLGSVRADRVLARGPGVTVVRDCGRGSCGPAAYDDGGDLLWRSDDYGAPVVVPVADQMPPRSTDTGDVLPAEVVLARDDDDPDGATYDVLDPRTGEVQRSFEAQQAGSSLNRDGESRVFAVQDSDGQCRVRVWSDDETSVSEPESCTTAVAAVGDHVVFDGDPGSRVVDLADPAESGFVYPTADIGPGANQAPVLNDTGVGGSTVLRMAFDGPNVQISTRVASGGPWGTTYSQWWRHDTAVDVTSAQVFDSSTLIGSRSTSLNPWDSPGVDDRELDVVDLDSGTVTGHRRIDTQVDSSTGLPDGSVLVALRGGELFRLGGPRR